MRHLLLAILGRAMKTILAVASILASAALPNALHAGEISTDSVEHLFGHNITVFETDLTRTLKVDGRDMVADRYIDFEEVTIVGNVPVLIGNSSGGGNMCGPTPLVISFPEGQAPKIDRPADMCSETEYKIVGDSLEFRTPDEIAATYGQDKWTWTRKDGFDSGTRTEPKADISKGWEAIREHAWQYPSDLLGNGAVNAQLHRLLGKRYNEFRALLIGLPQDHEFPGKDYFGTTCISHSCPFGGGFIYLSGRDGKIYAARKGAEEVDEVQTSTPVRTWPKNVRDHLKTWAAKW
ncbi:hypothetical protein GOA58_25245 [Sinorhizobium meliloti]|uniref:hypothetical protein n=1 Tax=Rhizobium meliloti TaxID=382 RepID=UPI00299E3FDA|nr:hypothetical protein [Sinorhizobium meliloti]MDW9663831.1 hypothetical protein [Sinorhizobium meliloti]MDX0053598.1 hypothetical protein [Sinorhizobium meliloti]